MYILETKTIYRDEEYPTFPNLAKLQDGTVICAFRHALERQKEYGSYTHIDPTAKDVFIVSPDQGTTFDSEFHVIVDDPMISNQDPCISVLSDGRIIATYFRWLLAPKGQGEAVWGSENFNSYGHSVLNQYDAYPGGAAYSISDDNGKTWRHMPELIVEGAPSGIAVRGNIIELPNGDLLLPYYGSLKLGQLSSSGLFRSTDRGETWQDYSIMAFDPDCIKNFVEPNVIRTKSGRIVALFRTQTDWRKSATYNETYQNLHIAVSEDDGKTFGPVQEVENCWGSNPFHALQLESGNILLSFGYRRSPYGMRVRLCNGELTNISDAEELILRDDGIGEDLGYPNAIQLDNGDILVAYYIGGADTIRTIDVTRIRED